MTNVTPVAPIFDLAQVTADTARALVLRVGQEMTATILNMAGNAAEWVDAPYKPYKGNQTPDPDYGKDDRVIRGGTFYHASTEVESRTSYRNHLPRVFLKGQSAPVGIRCVIPADDPRIQSLVRAGSK